MAIRNLKLGRGGPPGIGSVIACDTCPASRFARRFANDEVLYDPDDPDRPEAMDDEESARPGALEIFRRVGCNLAKKLSAADWMDLRSFLLKEDAAAAADDLPLNGTQTENGFPRNNLESRRTPAMDARLSGAAASFYELFPEAQSHHVGFSAGDPVRVACNHPASQSPFGA